MYTKIMNVQILVSLLKQHGIRHLVLSAGTRHVPLAHSVENDPFFHCYSVVDERSAGYYAIGLAKELGEPVAIACTSSTATCNYTPPVAEAFYQKVPLLVLTGDRDPYRLGQLEDQMINQVDMYKNFCRKCVNLPLVNNDYDVWYCQRLINEALLELRHQGGGPVQINFPINQTIEDIADASIPELPVYNMIRRYELSSPDEQWKAKVAELKNYRRIMVICGSGAPLSAQDEKAMSDFAAKYNCVFATEPLSNIHCEGSLNTYLMAESITGKVLKQIAPDLMIFFGGNFISRLKNMMRGTQECKSWVISEDGDIRDPFQNLSTVFECSPGHFFRYFADHAGSIRNNKELYLDFQGIISKIKLPDMGNLAKQANTFAINDAKYKQLPPPEKAELLPENYISSMLAFSELAKRLPRNALMHLSILNSTRFMSMFPIDDSVAVYSNIGTDGIDGSMSTFFGQAAASNRPCYLIIGDLSFFYDMNSLGIRNIKPNVHILLINNGGGAEFYYSMGPKLLPNIDTHIAASHGKRAKEWVEANNFRYMEAKNAEEFANQIDAFASPQGDRPVVFEVFTHKENDIKIYKTFARLIRQDTTLRTVAKQIEEVPLVRKALETTVGQSIKEKLKNLF